MRFVIIALLFSCFLASCGSAPTAEVPLYPGAQSIQRGNVPIADVLADSFVQQLGGANRLSAIALYRVADTTTWENIKEFYSAQTTGWQPENAILTEGDTFSFIGWTRGNQLFAVGFVDNASGEGAYLTVASLTR
jgi:hypothetical protein